MVALSQSAVKHIHNNFAKRKLIIGIHGIWASLVSKFCSCLTLMIFHFTGEKSGDFNLSLTFCLLIFSYTTSIWYVLSLLESGMGSDLEQIYPFIYFKINIPVCLWCSKRSTTISNYQNCLESQP